MKKVKSSRSADICKCIRIKFKWEFSLIWSVSEKRPSSTEVSWKYLHENKYILADLWTQLYFFYLLKKNKKKMVVDFIIGSPEP